MKNTKHISFFKNLFCTLLTGVFVFSCGESKESTADDGELLVTPAPSTNSSTGSHTVGQQDRTFNAVDQCAIRAQNDADRKNCFASPIPRSAHYYNTGRPERGEEATSKRSQ